MGGLIQLVLAVLIFVGMFKTFQKMGYDDAWWAIVPFLNLVFFIKVIEKPIWWVILFFIPFANLYVAYLVAEKVSKSFGKGLGYTLGLMFLGFIFYPILGFGSEQPQIAAS